MELYPVAKAVLEYLTRQNRPYSATDIFNNLHKEFGKTAVEKTLESLADQGKIKRKLYGKQKVYVADQSLYPDVDDSELKSMDSKITSLTEEVKTEQDATRKLDAELRRLSSSLTTDEAQRHLRDITTECEQHHTKLETLKSNPTAVLPEERDKIMSTRLKYVKEWRKRKRMANDILSAILEGYPKSKKELYEDIGIETDEEYKVKPPDI